MAQTVQIDLPPGFRLVLERDPLAEDEDLIELVPPGDIADSDDEDDETEEEA